MILLAEDHNPRVRVALLLAAMARPALEFRPPPPPQVQSIDGLTVEKLRRARDILNSARVPYTITATNDYSGIEAYPEPAHPNGRKDFGMKRRARR